MDSTNDNFDPINESYDPNPEVYRRKGVNDEQVEILVKLEQQLNELHKEEYLKRLEDHIEGAIYWLQEKKKIGENFYEELKSLKFMVKEKMGIQRGKYKIFWQLGSISSLEVEDGNVVGLLLYTHIENLILPEIPEVLGDLVSLKKLTMQGRGRFGIKEVPNFVAKLINLEYLDLAGNSINMIPEFLVQLPKLKYIDLRGNWLAEIPKFLEKKDGLDVHYKEELVSSS